MNNKKRKIIIATIKIKIMIVIIIITPSDGLQTILFLERMCVPEKPGGRGGGRGLLGGGEGRR